MGFDLNPQLISDLHGAFINFQRSIGRLHASGGKDHPDKLQTAILNGLVHHRNAVNRQITNETSKEAAEGCREVMALIQLVEIVGFKGVEDTLVFEGWLEESFPVGGDEDFWSVLFRLLVRKRYDQVCMMLQQLLSDGTQPNWYSPLQSLITLFLAYPTHRQRHQHPHMLDLWHDEVRRLLRTEQGTGWPRELWLVLEVIEGRESERVAAFCRHWQEPFVAGIVHALTRVQRTELYSLAVQSMEMVGGGPKSIFDKASLALLNGDLDGFFEEIKELDWLYPHMLSIFWASGGLQKIYPDKASQLYSETTRKYAETIYENAPFFWNLSADYFVAASVNGNRRDLESFLFGIAKQSKNADKRQAIIDLSHSFELVSLGDAIHIMIAEEAVKDGNLHLALTHAIQSRQTALITRICDAIFEEHVKNPTAPLDYVDDELIDISEYPRLVLLSKYQYLLNLMAAGKLDLAKSIFAAHIIDSSIFMVPDRLKPHLLTIYQRLCDDNPFDDAFVSKPVLMIMLRYLNSKHVEALADIQPIRLLLVRQSAWLNTKFLS